MHFLAWVVIEGAGDVDADVTARLAPYDHALAVAHEASDCWCWGQVARAEVGAWADEAFVDLREEMRHADPAGPAATLIRTRIQVETDARVGAHPAHDQPDPACPECDGSGITQDAYNPNGAWDWWQIGGRWSGACDPDGEDDVLPVALALRGLSGPQALVPNAVIDGDGVWHSDPDGLWSTTDGTEWIATLSALLADADAACRVVVVDCHT